MTSAPSGPAGWAEAADRLAARATRRARTEAFSRPAAFALTATGAVLLISKAVGGLDATDSGLVATVGTIAAIYLGTKAARRVVPTSRATAAWALDRLALARERGLTLAMTGEQSARSIDRAPIPRPPSTRLRPAEGTVWVLCAGLVAFAGVLWRGPQPAPAIASSESRLHRRNDAHGAAGALDALRKDADARTSEALAVSDRRIRDALGLPPLAPLDVTRVAERLADPSARKAALDAAPPESAASAALVSQDAGAAAALVRALESGRASEAEALRRDAASLRAGFDSVPIPPTRRAVVARYLSLRLSGQAPDAQDPK